jgi:hypothetical protein
VNLNRTAGTMPVPSHRVAQILIAAMMLLIAIAVGVYLECRRLGTVHDPHLSLGGVAQLVEMYAVMGAVGIGLLGCRRKWWLSPHTLLPPVVSGAFVLVAFAGGALVAGMAPLGVAQGMVALAVVLSLTLPLQLRLWMRLLKRETPGVAWLDMAALGTWLVASLFTAWALRWLLRLAAS